MQINANRRLLYFVLIKHLLEALLVFTLSFLIVGAIEAFVLSIKGNGQFGTTSLIFAILFSILYYAYYIIDVNIFIKNTSLGLKENGVEIHSATLLNRQNNTIPFAQINNIELHQTFFQKIFNIAKLLIFQEGGVNSIGGFDYLEGSKFIDEFNQKYNIKIKQ